MYGASSSRSALRLVLHFSCLCILTAGLGYAVFDSGGRSAIAWNLCLVAAGFVALAYWLTPRSPIPPQVDSERWVAWGVFLLTVFVALQVTPVPLWLLKFLSPATAQATESLGVVMEIPALAPISVSPANTFRYLARLLGYALVFLTVRELANRAPAPRAFLLALPLILIATSDAAWSLLRPQAGVPAAGTYINRNHFAGLLEMVLPMALAYVLDLLWREDSRESDASDFRIAQASAIGFAALLMFWALLTSLSKMGFIACLGAVFLMAAITFRSVGRGRQRLVVMLGLAGVFLCVFVLFAPEELRKALGKASSDLTLEGRRPVWESTLKLIWDYPLFGCGLGAFQNAFLKYQRSSIELSYDFAHNDYLQSWAELGLIGGLILAVIAGRILLHVVRVTLRAPDPHSRHLALGCLGGMCAIGLHSLTDFNLHIPANAMVLAWLAAIGAGIPLNAQATTTRPALRYLAAAGGLLLIGYAAATILFQTRYQSDQAAERAFCRFGICTTGNMSDDSAGNSEKLPQTRRADLLEWLRREPANPIRWSDLATDFSNSGDTQKAAICFAQALVLGPEVPPVLLDIADFYHKTHQDQRSLEQTAHVLARTDFYDTFIFRSYAESGFTPSDVLRYGLPPGNRAALAYFDYLVTAGASVELAPLVWDLLVSRGYTDDRRLHAYMALLMNNKQYATAAGLWSKHLGKARNGYRESNWVYDGGFEVEQPDSPFDWELSPIEGAQASRDKTVAHSGKQSLRIEFEGKGNVNFAHVTQLTVPPPGAYRFQAYVRTQAITTDQGIGFQLADPEGHSQPVLTENLTGTTDWHKIEHKLCVSPRTHRIDLRVIRRPSARFFRISGTAWIDSVQLVRLSESCSP